MDYEPSDIERYAVEPVSGEKRGAGDRTPFQRDRARILHSAALRRLAGKTQVVAPGESDFPRTRLTHSLEVAQIGRELAGGFGADPDLVEAACLAHDLGHPPFGHTGEDALNEVCGAIGGFEGNAQNLRIMSRLEAKIVTSDGRSAGINATRALLDATTKYPWRRREDTRKFGAYRDDLPVFRWVRAATPAEYAEAKCFEAQVMDWSDDVAYSVHDLEDAIFSGKIDPKLLTVGEERAALFERTRGYAPDAEVEELAEALDRLQALEWWPTEFDGSFTAQARLKRTSSELIGRFCRPVTRATRDVHGPGPLRRYTARLEVPRPTRLECELLKAAAARYVMETDRALVLRRTQSDLIKDLVERLTDRPELLDPPFAESYAHASDDAARLRIFVDQVATYTDARAYATYRTLLVGGRK
ncbi:MAG TPA: deoxyguanosinetriphosphate triphosphohydrolase [Actinospica sp.]|nr:deoxyguanosinetriphosphate triphosphohydrolase [Actinospica sp.]